MWCTAPMAKARKLNWARRPSTQHYKVQIHVHDPDCLFSIKPQISYMRVVRATSEKAAARAAATYCAKYMHDYAGVTFEYSKNDMEEYSYYLADVATKEEV